MPPCPAKLMRATRLGLALTAFAAFAILVPRLEAPGDIPTTRPQVGTEPIGPTNSPVHHDNGNVIERPATNA